MFNLEANKVKESNGISSASSDVTPDTEDAPEIKSTSKSSDAKCSFTDKTINFEMHPEEVDSGIDSNHAKGNDESTDGVKADDDSPLESNPSTPSEEVSESTKAKKINPYASGPPWQQLLSLPPQQILVIERMHSGARRFVVLDFGAPVLLTGLFN